VGIILLDLGNFRVTGKSDLQNQCYTMLLHRTLFLKNDVS